MKPGDRRIRVLVADDSATARACICDYLEFERVFEVVGTACDGVQLLHKTKDVLPDLVLTDLNMPNMGGMEAASELRKSYPQVRTLIITQFGGSTVKDECLRRGADGYLEKNQMPEKLMKEVARLFPGTTELQ
jgi:DNA-binding NarL/FixJ family response regulator